MTFIILFEDNDEAPANIRSRLMQDHLRFLARNSQAIAAAGPLLTQDGVGAGGLWIVEAEAAAVVERLVHADPFWPTGLRKSYSILRWHQVFAAGRPVEPPA